jgi:transposase
VLLDYVRALEEATERVDRLTTNIEELVASWKHAPGVKALQAFRGIQLVTAFAIVTEICDFRRFGNAHQFMAYLGLVPGEKSSGATRRRGSITRAGNTHVRRLLIESSWSYRFGEPSRLIRKRRVGLPDDIVGIARKADERLHRRMSRLVGRGVLKQKAVVAVARELSGFIWAMGQKEVAA